MCKHLIALFLVIVVAASGQKQFPLSGAGWQFRQAGTELFYQAEVPGTVHQDLMRNHLIPDPYYQTNEQLVQWVEDKDWEYKNTFICDEQIAAYRHTELVFEGLDTYAKIFINGEEVLQSTNMFLKYKVDVKKFIKKGALLEIRVLFESALRHGREEAKKLPYTLPGEEKVFTRKAQYQYGWDWGPRLVTCGMYKPVYLNCWNEMRVISMHHEVKTLTDTLAEVFIISEIECDKALKQAVVLDCRLHKLPDHLEDHSFGYARDTFDLKEGINTDTILVNIRNPERWHCNGQGGQAMYVAYLWPGNHSSIPLREINFALRTVELVKENDAFGETFYFRVNGKPTFMKGANLIPPDNFVAQINGGYYADLINKAKEANLNMLRVWGGGLYPSEDFYELCDRNGILVWQDFMFACAMYPGDKRFLQDVKREAEQQVERLRNHPCLALWCGNNENDEGWHNWGWQKQYRYSKTDSARIWQDYQTLFHNILPEAVHTYDPKTAYVSSSPMLGWGRKESMLRGDSHYWGVWWGMEPFGMYEKKVGRFMSEYGFQGMPGYFTLKHYGDSLNFHSAYIKAHQKHPIGYQTINTYMERDYKVPSDFFNYVYTSQLLQRDGMQTAIEAHRRNKPYCMGSLYWQWNDCWPVTSWSAIDYDHQPKALYYATKKLYANLCLSVDSTGGRYRVYVISDSTAPMHARLEVRLKNTKGETLLKKIKDISIKENSSEAFENFSGEELKPFDKSGIYLSCTLIMNGKNRAHKNYFFVKPKELLLYRPDIHIRQKNGSIHITSDVFVKDLYLFTKEKELSLPDNYMDLEPNEPIELKVPAGAKLSGQIQYLSLYDINP